MDSNKTAGEEARRQLHKNAASNLEQVLAATPHKTPTVRPPASYHKKLFKLGEPDMQDTHGPPHKAGQKLDDQHEHTFSNYVRIRDVVQKTCQRRWTIGKSGERGSGYPCQWHDVMMMMMIIHLFLRICMIFAHNYRLLSIPSNTNNHTFSNNHFYFMKYLNV